MTAAKNSISDTHDRVRSIHSAGVTLMGVSCINHLCDIGMILKPSTVSSVSRTGEFEQSAPLIEEAHAIAEPPAESEDRVESG